ncbi:MAG TPA: polysaccharide deacetylase family protein [Propionibacteriaceae bacterium]|nr:polysaccharide deacetylase family protein [Propionibacteriaceae bacterium]
MPTTTRVVALTFDGGSGAEGLPSILATLKREGVPATFFLTGRWVQAHPAQTKTLASAYPIGNHSMTHPEFTALSSSAVRTEIIKTTELIRSVTGKTPSLFRFPFGDRDSRTIALVNEQCLLPVRWTVDSLGWKGTSGGMSTSLVRTRVVDRVEPGGIVLMHLGANPDDGTTLDAAALPGIISDLRARGYRFITVAEAFGR